MLRRDPWLVSQSLMQLLYLLPPAFLLWLSFYEGRGVSALLAPVLIIAAGQLAGSLAWLAISGEDAPDLIASAPVTNARVLRAKTEAVLAVIAGVFGPFIIALAAVAPLSALVTALGVATATGSATSIQFWFRVPHAWHVTTAGHQFQQSARAAAARFNPAAEIPPQATPCPSPRIAAAQLPRASSGACNRAAPGFCASRIPKTAQRSASGVHDHR